MFQSARLKLTASYLLIIMAISISFSTVIYNVLTREVERFARSQRLRFERRIQIPLSPSLLPDNLPVPLPIEIDPDLVYETEHRILLMLILVNAGILVFSGGMGYVLAGRTLKPIAEMVDEQNRFISDASHELRTPLTSLKSAFEVFLRNKKQSLTEARTLVSESINEVNTLQSLSDSLLQLAQYQRPNGKNIFEKVSLHEVMTEAVHRITPVATRKNITVEKRSQELYVLGDKYSLIDLLVILLDNAVKYSKTGTVTITGKSSEKNTLIAVRDHGVGIDTKDIPHIFDRFYRADSARSKNNAKGYGLGLSIAKKIIEMHNGTIEVVSKLNQGSTFTVKIPKLFS